MLKFREAITFLLDLSYAVTGSATYTFTSTIRTPWYRWIGKRVYHTSVFRWLQYENVAPWKSNERAARTIIAEKNSLMVHFWTLFPSPSSRRYLLLAFTTSVSFRAVRSFVLLHRQACRIPLFSHSYITYSRTIYVTSFVTIIIIIIIIIGVMLLVEEK